MNVPLTALRLALVFFGLMLFQVYVLDNIAISSLASPVLWVYILLLLPLMPAWAELPLAFALGLWMDFFYYTPGVNAAAATAALFVRRPLTRFIKLPEGDEVAEPTLTYLGWRGFILMLALFSLTFHAFRIGLSEFGLRSPALSILRLGMDTALTMVMVFLIQVIFYRRRAEE